MISSVKNVKANDLNLEDNLLLGSKDMNFIKKDSIPVESGPWRIP